MKQSVTMPHGPPLFRRTNVPGTAILTEQTGRLTRINSESLNDFLGASLISTLVGGEVGDDLRPGDVVRVKSGGPNMTVKAVAPDGITGEPTVWCEWFDKNHKSQNGTFSPSVLERL